MRFCLLYTAKPISHPLILRTGDTFVDLLHIMASHAPRVTGVVEVSPSCLGVEGHLQHVTSLLQGHIETSNHSHSKLGVHRVLSSLKCVFGLLVWGMIVGSHWNCRVEISLHYKGKKTTT